VLFFFQDLEEFAGRAFFLCFNFLGGCATLFIGFIEAA